MPKILLIKDDKDISEMVTEYLTAVVITFTIYTMAAKINDIEINGVS